MGLSMKKVENLLIQKKQSESLLQKTNDALNVFVNEIRRLKKVLAQAVGQSDSGSQQSAGSS